MNDNLPERAAKLVRDLGLEPLPEEGGLFRQNHQDENSTAIYYLLADPDFSALHRLDSPEVYHWYTGDALQLVIIHPDGRVEEPVVGPRIDEGEHFQYVVPAGTWHGSRCRGEWVLVGTTMAPGFSWQGFELADRTDLSEKFPHAAKVIEKYTRAN